MVGERVGRWERKCAVGEEVGGVVGEAMGGGGEDGGEKVVVGNDVRYCGGGGGWWVMGETMSGAVG